MSASANGSGAAGMQLAVVNASSALTMPTEAFVELYCQPIQDDTWIRHEEIVKLSDVVENEGGEAIKKEILKEHLEERVRSGQTMPPDPILEGMLMQEQFMHEYQARDHSADRDRAAQYRQQLVRNYRRSHPNPPAAPVLLEERPNGANPASVPADQGETAAEYPTEEASTVPKEEEDAPAKPESTPEEADTAAHPEEAEECAEATAKTFAHTSSPKAAADVENGDDAATTGTNLAADEL